MTSASQIGKTKKKKSNSKLLYVVHVVCSHTNLIRAEFLQSIIVTFNGPLAKYAFPLSVQNKLSGSGAGARCLLESQALGKTTIQASTLAPICQLNIQNKLCERGGRRSNTLLLCQKMSK